MASTLQGFVSQGRAHLAYFQSRAFLRARSLRRWFREEGVSGVVRHLVRYAQGLRNFHRREDEFDKSLGVDTKGPIGLWHLRIQSENVREAARYEGVNPSVLRELLQGLRLRQGFSSYTFVDLGCGKGRALLIASEFGFGKLIGVEFAPELARTAEENCQRLDLPAKILNQDATEFRFPSTDLVVYLYNPFGATILKRVFDHLVEVAPMNCYILYVNPLHRKCIDDHPGAELLPSQPGTAAWKLRARVSQPRTAPSHSLPRSV